MKMVKMNWLLYLALAIGVAACDSSSSDNASTILPVAGNYVDDWGTAIAITEETWAQTFEDWEKPGVMITAVSTILDWDNSGEYLTAENEDGTFSRFDWTQFGEVFYYCQIEYAAVSEEIALANETADRKKLDTGCGGFSWSKLTPAK